jgi:hypothetical protein
MARLEMSIPHHLSQDEAVQRIKRLLETVKSEHADKINELRESWNENVGTFNLSALGFSVSGTIAVMPDEVQLSGDLPFAASFFKSRIETTIRERAAELLA